MEHHSIPEFAPSSGAGPDAAAFALPRPRAENTAPMAKPPILTWNMDCIRGAAEKLADGSVDLFITDPPYGIGGDKLHAHYHRDESFVIDGYVEVSGAEYASFTRAWLAQAVRVLRPGGSFYIVSGWTRLREVLDALHETPLTLVNHLIWKYHFGVNTRLKYVTSHYHILYGTKPGEKPVFNSHDRFGPQERTEDGRSLLYRDLEDVWDIPRVYKPGQVKNKNELPEELLVKMIQYSSRPGDQVCDFFLGGFTTLRVALAMGRGGTGFELNPKAYHSGAAALANVCPGELLSSQRKPSTRAPANQHQPWSLKQRRELWARFAAMKEAGLTKAQAIEKLGAAFGRGRFSIMNALAETVKRRKTSG